MKIHSLKALNINSLKGEISVDFEALTKESALFAITGPTGSGKSTLLDIISCALYGRTARLKNPNDLMSRHSGEAYCEVEFEIKGKVYRSSWSQKRARKKHDGNFQSAKMELSDVERAEVLMTGSREVPKYIEELSGLDFGRFTQSMLLAQGGFDAFLKADEKERSALLEKITGTQIYAEISKAVYEKYSALDKDMEADRRVLDSMTLLEDEALAKKEQELREYMVQKLSSDKGLEEIHNALQWRSTLDEMQKNFDKQVLLLSEATLLKEQSSNDFEKLSLAERALNVEATWRAKTSLVNSLLLDKKNLLGLEDEQVQMNEAWIKAQELSTFSNISFEKARVHFEKENTKLKALATVLTQKEERSLSRRNLEERIENRETILKKSDSNLVQLESSYEKQSSEIAEIKSYLNTHAKDEDLSESLGLIEQNIIYYSESLLNSSSLSSTLEQQSILFESEANTFELLKKNVDTLKTVYEEAQELYNKVDTSAQAFALEEAVLEKKVSVDEKALFNFQKHQEILLKIKSEEQSLMIGRIEMIAKIEMSKLSLAHLDEMKKHIQTLRAKKEREQLIQKYEEDRTHLIAGEACSLCGSLEHPFVEHQSEIHLDATTFMINEALDMLAIKEKDFQVIENGLSVQESKLESSALEIKKLQEERTVYPLSTQSEVDLKEDLENSNTALLSLKERRLKQDQLLKALSLAKEQFNNEEKLLEAKRFLVQKLESEKVQNHSALETSNLKSDAYFKTLQVYAENFSFSLNDLDLALEDLTKRKGYYLKTQLLLKSSEEKLALCSVDKKESETTIKALSAEIARDRENLSNIMTEIKALVEEGIRILNVVDITLYERELEQNYKVAQSNHQEAQNAFQTLGVQLEERAEVKRVLSFRIDKDERECSALTQTFIALLQENSFKNEDVLKDALLESEVRELLRKKCEAIETKFTQTQALFKESEKRLKEHAGMNLSLKPLSDLETKAALLKQKSDSFQHSVGALSQELEINSEKSAESKSKVLDLGKKKENFRVWVKLQELIGSADGTKFKKFAQGITLDQLITLANQHLEVLSTRYTLLRSENKLLELEIVDAYQGNVVRPVGTLSGGESFIVSLALALGLSELSSQKISIDSLFLDEGFGTLDEESLELALNALNLLQSRGKMIGVISHVEALKERIPLQIKINPNGDGTSSVEMCL